MVVADLDFANDICLLADNPEDAWKLLDRMAENAACVGLEINIDKTKLCSHTIVQNFIVKSTTKK